jgi:1,4-dihydroxy-2-naphthoyl-CoA hydrolase
MDDVAADAQDLGSTGNFQDALGIELVDASADRVVFRSTIKPVMHQPYGIVHGGVYCTLVETAASVAAAIWFGERGHVVGVNNSTNFIRATREGTLTATATPLQRGRTQQLWQVAVVDDDDRLVAHGQVRLANITNAEQIGGTSGAALPKP